MGQSMKVGDIVTVHLGDYLTEWFVVAGFDEATDGFMVILNTLEGEFFYAYRREHLSKISRSAIMARVYRIITELDTLTKSLVPDLEENV